MSELWNNYWWILPAALFVLCLFGCIFSRKHGSGGCPCCRKTDA